MTRVEVDTFPEPVVLLAFVSKRKRQRKRSCSNAREHFRRVSRTGAKHAFLCGIDIAGTKSLFGPPEMLARSSAPTSESAWYFRFGDGQQQLSCGCLPCQRIAAGLLSMLSRQEVRPRHCLLCPLSVLDLTEKQAETFALWGIHTLGMLAALPEKELIARMGQESRRLRQLARANCRIYFNRSSRSSLSKSGWNSIAGRTPGSCSSVSASCSINSSCERKRASSRCLRHGDAHRWMAAASHTRTVRPALPTNDKQLWIKLLHLDLEAHPPQAAILAVALHAEPGSTSKVQLGLFSPQLPEASTSRCDACAHPRDRWRRQCRPRGACRTHMRRKRFASSPSPYPPATLRAATPPEPRASMRQLRPPETIRSPCRDARPQSSSFATSDTPSNTPMVLARKRRLVEPDTLGLRAMGSGGAGAGRSLLCCCLMRDLMQNRLADGGAL